MKMSFKLSFFSLFLVLSTPSVEAVQVMNNDIRDLDFNEVVSCLKNRRLLKIGKDEYAVCKKEPKFKGKDNEINPCYSLGLGPRLFKESDLEKLPSPLPSFNVLIANKDEAGEYLTVSFTSHNNPHWPSMFLSPIVLEDRYWDEVHTRDAAVPYRYVSFLLKKVF